MKGVFIMGGERTNVRFAGPIVPDITSTPAELNLLDGAIYTAAELNAAVHSAALLAAAPAAAGIKIQIGNKRYVSAYNETGTATVIGEVVIIDYANDYAVKAIVAATKTFPVTTAISLAIAAAHALDWYQYAGEAEALVDGDTVDVAVGDFLEICNTALAFVKDGSARTTLSAAVAVDANATTSALKTVILIPEQHTMAAA